jgi:succinyl-diaminopimelate desuccinylase
MTASARAQEWLSVARQRLPEVVRFVQELVRIPSVNGRDSEAAVAQRVAAEAERLNLQNELVALDSQRPNVLAEWGRGEAGFVFVGHLDTVAEGPAQAWKHPPFEAQVDQGNLYGRGTADNKAGIACGLYTLALLRDRGRLDPAQVRLMLAGVVDEESGASSKLGVRYLLDQGRLQPARGAIYTYASDIVCVGHRGLLRLVLRAAGRAVHSGSPQWSRGQGGVNAVTGLAELLLRLEKLRLPAPAHPAFKGLRCKLTPGTIFHGGEFESMVPSAAEAMVDVRLMPGQPADEVLAAVQAAMRAVELRRPGLTFSLEVKNNLPGVALPAGHALVRTAQRWTHSVTGKTWPAVGAGPANEGYMLIQAGIPTLCGFGPTGGNAHAPDEWVNIESLAATLAMYAGIVSELLAGKE